MDEFARRLLETRREVEEVVVFGSFEDGRWAPGSDLDVFLILTSSDRPVRDRVEEYLPGPFPVGLDLFPFTRAEIASRAPSPLLDAVAKSAWRYRRA
jgi:predicted nucleotidyltransferase